MLDSTQDRPSSDEILARIVLEAEQVTEHQLDPEVYVKQYPHLAEDIRHLFHMRQTVEESRPDYLPNVPEKLGDFRIVRLIAQGGMGEVYEATQEGLKRRVAIKLIRRGRVSPEARTRFLREQEVLAQLHQTHIVPIHFADEEGTLQYFVMPYIDGAPLNRVVHMAATWESTHHTQKTPPLGQLASIVIAPPVGQTEPGSAETTRLAASLNRVEPGRARQRLSREYFRSVAQLMADAAEAVHHAHQAKPAILHRDLKPSNIMVDTSGHGWIIDYGLACYLRDGARVGANANGASLSEPPQATSSVVGTPEYMAPEQFAGQVDVRTDVWGLGVTLYELLTLQRAFGGKSYPEIKQQICSADECPSTRFITNVPADLSAICRKAAQKQPDKRYPTALDFAEELHRWLRGEPAKASRSGRVRRAWLWAKRNQGWATALGLACLSLLALSAATWSYGIMQERQTEATRQGLIRQLQSIRLGRLTSPRPGWVPDSKRLAREAAKIRVDATLKSEFVATLGMVDVTLLKQLGGQGAIGLAFDPRGEKLLLGGWDDKEPARLWNSTTDDLTPSKLPGNGPVAFRSDGTALQLALVSKDKPALHLWDVERQKLVHAFDLSEKTDPTAVLLAISQNGTTVAARVGLKDGSSQVTCWDTTNGMQVLSIPGSASAMGFSPDAGFLALGSDKGELSLWSLPKGQKTASIVGDPVRITAIAFGRNPVLGHHPWVLATGDPEGTITLWNLDSGRCSATCRGSDHGIAGLSFSPDGTLLASTSRGWAKLWDVPTGRLLLDVAGRTWLESVAFSPDGQQVAVSGLPHFEENQRPWSARVLRLDTGRGVKSLRGLNRRISWVRYSPDNRLVAALAQDWRIAMWETATGRLRFILEAPKGLLSDNADLAFDADGSRLAYVGGTHAVIWNTQSGAALWSTDALPPGLSDHLAFSPAGELLSFRVETKDRKVAPWGNVSPREHPRVCRIRNLLAGKPLDPIAEFSELNAGIYGTTFSLDGKQAIVSGNKLDDNGKTRWLACFDVRTGNVLWRHQSRFKSSSAQLELHPDGQRLAAHLEDSKTLTIIELKSGQLLGKLDHHHCNQWTATRYWVQPYRTPELGLDLRRASDQTQLVILNPDVDEGNISEQFNPTHTFLAWGNHDGTVTLVEIAEVQRRLAEVGLGWD